jgi:hypothetical protein
MNECVQTCIGPTQPPIRWVTRGRFSERRAEQFCLKQWLTTCGPWRHGVMPRTLRFHVASQWTLVLQPSLGFLFYPVTDVVIENVWIHLQRLMSSYTIQSRFFESRLFEVPFRPSWCEVVLCLIQRSVYVLVSACMRVFQALLVFILAVFLVYSCVLNEKECIHILLLFYCVLFYSLLFCYSVIYRVLLIQCIYKVVQIWPEQTVTCLHTNNPSHIWTTLYHNARKHMFSIVKILAVRAFR